MANHAAKLNPCDDTKVVLSFSLCAHIPPSSYSAPLYLMPMH